MIEETDNKIGKLIELAVEKELISIDELMEIVKKIKSKEQTPEVEIPQGPIVPNPQGPTVSNPVGPIVENPDVKESDIYGEENNDLESEEHKPFSR